jgi:hypothetical protein
LPFPVALKRLFSLPMVEAQQTLVNLVDPIALKKINPFDMKSKLIILVIVAAIMVSFTVANQSKQRGETAKSSHSGGSKYLSDKDQFN